MFRANMNAAVASRYDYQELDEEGFIIDPYSWNAAFTEARAAEKGIVLSAKHWQLIKLIRFKYMLLGAMPPMRTVCREIGLQKQELKERFGSCLNIWKLAGLPYPGEEAKTYMS